MAFDWREYLTLARSLLGEEGASYSEEAARRAAVSRAYYAAFCYARNFACNKLGFVPTRTGKDHGLLIAHYEAKEKLDSTLFGIADDLDDLLDYRRTCDYDDEVIVLTDFESLVKYALEDAQEIIDLLK
jgi:hypothetical protein